MFLNKQLRAAPSSSLHYSDIFISLSFLPFVWENIARMLSNELHEQQSQGVLIFSPFFSLYELKQRSPLFSGPLLGLFNDLKMVLNAGSPKTLPEQPVDRKGPQGCFFLLQQGRKCTMTIES